MTLNFLLREMTHLRYYIPIIEEGNRRGIKSKFCLMSSGKYNCPTKHTDVCKKVMIKLTLSNVIPNTRTSRTI